MAIVRLPPAKTTALQFLPASVSSKYRASTHLLQSPSRVSPNFSIHIHFLKIPIEVTMATDSFLKKKWERVFYTFFDTNRNKVIDWNDFELLFDKIKETRGAGSNEYKIVREAMNAVWDGLLSSAQELAGKEFTEISVEDWNRVWSRFDPKHMPLWQWEYLKYMFFLIDTTGDKLIDKKEFSEVMQIFGMSESDAKKSFDKIAVDDKGDAIGTIDYGQFVDLWRDYFSSTDPSRPGSWLFGPW